MGHINPPVLFLNPSCLQAPAPARPGPRNHVHAPLCPQCRKGCILLAATRMAHSELARARLGRAGASGGIPDGPVYRPNQRCHVPGGKYLCISTSVLPRTVLWQSRGKPSRRAAWCDSSPRGIRVSETPVLRGFSLALRPSPPVSRHRCLLRHRCRLRQCRRRPLAATDRRRRRRPTAMNTIAYAAVATTPATIVTAAAAAAVIVVAAPAAPRAGAEADVVPSRRSPPPPLPHAPCSCRCRRCRRRRQRCRRARCRCNIRCSRWR